MGRSADVLFGKIWSSKFPWLLPVLSCTYTIDSALLYLYNRQRPHVHYMYSMAVKVRNATTYSSRSTAIRKYFEFDIFPKTHLQVSPISWDYSLKFKNDYA
jgi:hypothetical protein